MIFIDWQLSRCVSPVIDLVYFIYLSTDKNLRDNHLKELYEYYYQNLGANLELLGESISELYPKEEFELHIKKFSRFGLWVTMLILHVILSREEEIFDSDEILNRKEQFEEAMLKKAINDPNYRSRVHDIIIEMFNEGYA